MAGRDGNSEDILGRELYKVKVKASVSYVF